MDIFTLTAFIKTQWYGGTAIANMFHAANNLRAVNMPERDVVGWWKVLCRKRVQRANINVTHGVTFTGTHGR